MCSYQTETGKESGSEAEDLVDQYLRIFLYTLS